MSGLLNFVTFGLAGVVSKALAPKPQAPQQVQIPRPAQVRTNSTVSDALLARKGSRANQRTGPRGAEAPGGTKTKLGQ